MLGIEYDVNGDGWKPLSQSVGVHLANNPLFALIPTPNSEIINMVIPGGEVIARVTLKPGSQVGFGSPNDDSFISVRLPQAQ